MYGDDFSKFTLYCIVRFEAKTQIFRWHTFHMTKYCDHDHILSLHDSLITIHTRKVILKDFFEALRQS